MDILRGCSTSVHYKTRICTKRWQRQAPRWTRTASTNEHNVEINLISSTVRARASSNPGAQHRYARLRARLIATLSRLRLNRNAMSRGTSSPLDVAIEKITTGASWPWKASTVPTGTPGGSF